MNLKYYAKFALKDFIYRDLVPGLGCKPDRIHTWISALQDTQSHKGHIVEIGCNMGRNAAYSYYYLTRIEKPRPYLCIDTFGGFVESQFKADEQKGTPAHMGKMFRANSQSLCRWYLNNNGARDVELMQADIVALPDDDLPKKISAALIDVDLEEPVYHALKKIYPRMEKGGIIVVDDCDGLEWKGDIGYRRFMSEMGLKPEHEHGMGLVRIPK